MAIQINNEAKRLLLERSCRNCNIHRAVVKTAHTVTLSGSLTLGNELDRRIFLETMYPLILKKGCRLNLAFDNINDELKLIFPKKGYCSKWMKIDESEMLE
jgi:hypothetical protein